MIILLLSLIVLGFTLYFGYTQSAGVMAISTVIFLALLFFAHIDQIEEFRASSKGLEAKTRTVVERAEVTLEQLQKLSALVAKLQISLLLRQGRFGGFSEEEQQSYRTKLLELLDTVGVSDAQKEDVLADVHRFAIFDLRNKILGGGEWPKGLSNEFSSRYRSLRECGLDGSVPPEDLETFLIDSGLMNEERKELLEDYRFYLAHRKHRRPKVFASLAK